MKRIFITFLAFFYLSVASGAGVNLHYCMDKLVDWSLTKSANTTCSSCGMKKQESAKKSCCKDVQHQSKIDQAKQTDLISYKFQVSPIVIFGSTISYFKLAVFSQTLNFTFGYHAPPLSDELPIFIRNCTFRI